MQCRPGPLIPTAVWKILLSKTTGLEQVKVGKGSMLQLCPVMPESSIPTNINVIEFDAVISPPFCTINPVLLSIAVVMIVSGGVFIHRRIGWRYWRCSN